MTSRHQKIISPDSLTTFQDTKTTRKAPKTAFLSKPAKNSHLKPPLET
jgi:hypothetical protein